MTAPAKPQQINPAKAYANLIGLAARSLEVGDHGAQVTVNAWDLAALLREAGRQWAEIASVEPEADTVETVAAAGRLDPAVRIANDLVDRPNNTTAEPVTVPDLLVLPGGRDAD